MANVVGKRDSLETEVPQKLLGILMLLLVLDPLKQLKIDLYRNEAILLLFDQIRRFAVASLNPDEDAYIGVPPYV